MPPSRAATSNCNTALLFVKSQNATPLRQFDAKIVDKIQVTLALAVILHYNCCRVNPMAVVINGRTYELVTIVAKQLGVSWVTLYRASKAGKIPYIRLGGRRLVDLEAAQRFVATQYRRKTAEAMKRVWAQRKQKQRKRKS
jgi:excisionase family DNA binding protein